MSETTMLMTDDNNEEIQFTKFYTPTSSQPAEKKLGPGIAIKDDTRAGQILDCVNAHRLGTSFFCIIPDRVLTIVDPNEPGVPRLYRKVARPLDGRVQDPEKPEYTMSIQVPQLKDFNCPLSSSQEDIIKHLHEQGKRFMDLTSWDKRNMYPEVTNMIRISNPVQIVFAYGKLLKYISNTEGDVVSPEIGHVRVLKFAKGQVGKNDFVTVLNSAIKNKTDALGSSAWMSYFFNRSVGERNKIVTLSVSQSNDQIKTYMLATTLEETRTFEITKEDIEIADNLNKRVFNIEEFDDDYYHKLATAFDRVQDVVDDLGGRLSEDDEEKYPF